jgi:hypothetical protein
VQGGAVLGEATYATLRIGAQPPGSDTGCHAARQPMR